MARKFSPIEKLKFSFIVVIIRLDRDIKWGSSLTSSFTNTISAASTAISLPIPPIAIPTVAFFSAGASLIPSPIIQTACLFSWYFSISFNLSSGKQPAYTSPIPNCFAILLAEFSLSPVKSTGWTPQLCKASIISVLSFRMVSDKTRYPIISSSENM